jgi:hypothetical protein
MEKAIATNINSRIKYHLDSTASVSQPIVKHQYDNYD